MRGRSRGLWLEILRVLGITCAVVAGGLGIWAERARDRAAGGPRQDLRGRHPVLDPVHERVEQVLRLRAAAAPAVPDTRRRARVLWVILG